MINRPRTRGFIPAGIVSAVIAAAVLGPGVQGAHLFVALPYPGPIVSLAAAPTSATAGTAVVFTATSTFIASPRYEFWLRTSSTDWQMIQGYGASNTYNWNSIGAPTGIVYFGVWVKDATSSTSSFDANASLAFTVIPCETFMTATAATATVVHGSGTHVTITASAMSCTNALLYEFWIRTTSTDWELVQAYSASATYDWNSTGAPAGVVYFGVWVKDAQSGTATFDSNASTTVTVTAVACTAVSITALPTTVVHGVGTHVAITASATCPNAGLRYEFWLRTTSIDWFVIQPYGTTATYEWNTTGAPVTTVYIGVWAKDANSTTTSFDVNISVAIPVT